MTNPYAITALGGPLDGKDFHCEDLDHILNDFIHWSSISHSTFRRSHYTLICKEVNGEMVFRYRHKSSEDIPATEARGPSVAKQFRQRRNT